MTPRLDTLARRARRYGEMPESVQTVSNSVIDFTDDNNVDIGTEKRGITIDTNVSFASVDLTISSNTGSGITTIYVLDSSATVLNSTSPLNLDAGDIVTISPSGGFSSDTKYYLAGDAGGSSFAAGLYDSESYPIKSNDVNVTAGYDDGSEPNNKRFTFTKLTVNS